MRGRPQADRGELVKPRGCYPLYILWHIIWYYTSCRCFLKSTLKQFDWLRHCHTKLWLKSRINNISLQQIFKPIVEHWLNRLGAEWVNEKHTAHCTLCNPRSPFIIYLTQTLFHLKTLWSSYTCSPLTTTCLGIIFTNQLGPLLLFYTYNTQDLLCLTFRQVSSDHKYRISWER